MTNFSQENFRKSHEILDQFDKQIKCYTKMFETVGLLAPQTLPSIFHTKNLAWFCLLILFSFINLGLTNLAREKLSFCTVSVFPRIFLRKKDKVFEFWIFHSFCFCFRSFFLLFTKQVVINNLLRRYLLQIPVFYLTFVYG